MINNESLYDILEADRTSSREELKQCYQRLVRKHHPDKKDGATDTDRFRLLDLAWKTLSDEESRTKYDARLQSDEVGGGANVTDNVTLAEMTECIERGVYVYTCRCGGHYEVPTDLTTEDDASPLLVECNSCSLYISVTDFHMQVHPPDEEIASSSSSIT